MQSKLSLSTKLNPQGQTKIDRYFVSPPFKVLPLPNQDKHWQQGLTAMQMSSSPGLLAGDEYQIEIELAENTALSLTTQAFTRVQSMNDGDYAYQYQNIRLHKNSRLFYLPHPLVLHKDSALKQQTEIYLGQDSQLIYGEIVAVGRVLNDERFAFRHFASKLKIRSETQILLSDNLQWLPQKMPLTALSQMEDFTHQGTLVYLDLSKSGGEIKQRFLDFNQKFSQQFSEQQILLGTSLLNQGGFIIRALGYRAEKIEQLFQQMAQFLKADQTDFRDN